MASLHVRSFFREVGFVGGEWEGYTVKCGRDGEREREGTIVYEHTSRSSNVQVLKEVM